MNKYSIILPVRNGGAYVKDCVHSILAQTLPHFNLHVLDNHSTDGTPEWIRSLNDPRIDIIPAERPLGIVENWARITTIPKNEFITLIGHDDLLDPSYLQTMEDLINKHPDASLYQAHFRYINSEGGTIRKCQPMDEVQSAPEFTAFILSNTIDVSGTGFMIRAADYDAVGGIPAYPNLLFADFELWIKSTLKGYKATAFRECFAFRIHQSTTATSPGVEYQRALKRFVAFLESLQQRDEVFQVMIGRYALDFIQKYCKGLSHRLLRTPLDKREGYTVSGFMSQCKEYADRLVPGNDFNPHKKFSIKMAEQIDSHAFTRNLFLLFKKIYPKPVYRK